MRQRLAQHNAALGVRLHHDAASRGGGEAVGLDEERGRLGFCQGLFKKGDGGVVGVVFPFPSTYYHNQHAQTLPLPHTWK